MLNYIRNVVFIGAAGTVLTLIVVISLSSVVEGHKVVASVATGQNNLPTATATKKTNPVQLVAQKPTKPPKPADPSDEFFAKGIIPELRIEIAPANYEKLRGDPRNYVRCNIRENGQTVYKQCAVKLKGAAGSFRNIDDRPALSINLDKFEKDQKFHGLDKFHLNNSVQDESYVHEFIGSALSAYAKVPATRVTHARVWINDRDLGLYVLKEGFDKHFLSRYFEKTNGNLYDGGFLQDIDAPLQKDAGDGDDNRDDLKKLMEACREPDLEKRKARLEALLNVEEFLSFVAVELLTCHWDGYARNRNNYRIYFDPSTGKANFFPHGMDQLFNDPNAGMYDIPGTIVTAGVLQVPDFNARYQRRVKELTSFFSPPEALAKRLDELHARLKPVLATMHPDRAKQNEERVQDMKNRLAARAQNLLQQAAQRPEPLVFDANGIMKIGDWLPGPVEGGEVKCEQVEGPDGKPSYLIQCGKQEGRVIASWRRKVLLPPGKFQLQAEARVDKVLGFQDPKGIGAGIRLSGQERTNKLVGTTNWTKLTYDLSPLTAPQEMDLVLELRATRGQVWFEKDSLRIVKLP